MEINTGTLSTLAPYKGVLEALLNDYRRAVREERQMPPALALFTVKGEEMIDAHVMNVAPLVGNPIREIGLEMVMNEALYSEKSPVTALMFASEAWMSLRHTNAPPLDGPVEADPDRIEGVKVVFRTKEQKEVLIYRIDRVNKVLLPFEPTPEELKKTDPDGVGPTVH